MGSASGPATKDLIVASQVPSSAARILCSAVGFGIGGPPPSWAHTVLWSGRVGNPHGPRPDPGLLTIEVDTVLEAAQDQMTGSSHRPTEVAARR